MDYSRIGRDGFHPVHLDFERVIHRWTSVDTVEGVPTFLDRFMALVQPPGRELLASNGSRLVPIRGWETAVNRAS